MANLSKIRREKMLEYLEKLKEINNDDNSLLIVLINKPLYGGQNFLNRLSTTILNF